MELLDLLDSSVESIVTEIKTLRQENIEFQDQVTNFSLVVTDIEMLRLENERLTEQSFRDDKINANYANLQLENGNLCKGIDALNVKIKVQQNEFELLRNELHAKNEVQRNEIELLKDELIQAHKVKDIVLNKVNILLSRLNALKNEN